jgi:VanZ family protein
MESDSSTHKDGLLSMVLRWAPAVLMMAVIFLMSNTPGQDLPTFGVVDFLVKKSGHFLGYAVLGLAFLHVLGLERKRDAWAALLLVILYASSDELHQMYTPGRHSSPVDVGIDTAGAALAIWLTVQVYTLRRVVLAGR